MPSFGIMKRGTVGASFGGFAVGAAVFLILDKRRKVYA
jgi:hypothetical protein